MGQLFFGMHDLQHTYEQNSLYQFSHLVPPKLSQPLVYLLLGWGKKLCYDARTPVVWRPLVRASLTHVWSHLDYIVIIRRAHGKVMQMSHWAPLVETEPVMTRSHRVNPLTTTVFLLDSSKWKSPWTRLSINSSSQVEMSVRHIKDNGRNPFLALYSCTHVWNYPQGRIFACKGTL